MERSPSLSPAVRNIFPFGVVFWLQNICNLHALWFFFFCMFVCLMCHHREQQQQQQQSQNSFENTHTHKRTDGGTQKTVKRNARVQNVLSVGCFCCFCCFFSSFFFFTFFFCIFAQLCASRQSVVAFYIVFPPARILPSPLAPTLHPLAVRERAKREEEESTE